MIHWGLNTIMCPIFFFLAFSPIECLWVCVMILIILIIICNIICNISSQMILSRLQHNRPIASPVQHSSFNVGPSMRMDAATGFGQWLLLKYVELI